MTESDKKGKIYKLYCEDDGLYYIGSTHNQYLSKRYHSHKADSVKLVNRNNKAYNHFKNVGWDKVKIILIEEFPYTTKEDMRRIENSYIVKGLNDPLCLNNNRSFFTDAEKVLRLKECQRNFYDKHCQPVKCECGSEYRKYYADQHKLTKKHIEFINKNQQV